jgi:hypothetical protein
MQSFQGVPIVLTAPLTETVEKYGLSLQLALAALPGWMEPILNYRYPNWKNLPHNPDASASIAPCGLRAVELFLKNFIDPDQVVVALPEMLNYFIGPRTRVVGISTHNPMGAPLLGHGKESINRKYTRQLFREINTNPYRKNYRLIVGGAGSGQLLACNSFERYQIDCLVEGPVESLQVERLFRLALEGEPVSGIIKVVPSSHLILA